MRNYELLSKRVYHHEDGQFYWISSPNANVKAGDVAGHIRDGYIFIGFNNANHRASVLAFFMAYGRMPNGFIDHINGNRSDNRIENLRECSIAENNQNLSCLPKGKAKSSRFIGVYWYKRRNCWRAAIKHNGKKIDLGNYKTEEEAFQAYLNGKKRFHTFNPVPRDLDEAYRSIHEADCSTSGVDRI